jgi:hypothetical protein
VEGDRIASCGSGHRSRLENLETSPDPITDGQRINRWRVSLNAEGPGECRTTIRIYERPGNELIAQERAFRLRPGFNEIDLEPNQRYRFDKEEHCYQVTADIAGNFRPVDASRRFCARRHSKGRWTLQPRD